MQPEELKIGGKTFKHIGKPVPTEKLDKKWATIPERPTPSEDEVELMTMLDERLGTAKAHKQKKHDIWNFSYMQYRSVNHITGLYGGWPSFWNIWGTGVFIPRTF